MSIQMSEPTLNEHNGRKRRTSLWIIILIIAGAAGILFYCAGSVFGLFKPLDIGMRYTEADYVSAVEKTGINVVFSGFSDNEIGYGNVGYVITYSGFQNKVFELTPRETTALLNNLAPGIFWLSNIQIKAGQDGTIEVSTTVNTKKIKDALALQDDELVIPLPERTNIYVNGKISINNNKFKIISDDIKIGIFEFPKQYLTRDNISMVEQYLSDLLKTIPGLKINKLEQREGKFYFDGVIPQQIKVEKSPK